MIPSSSDIVEYDTKVEADHIPILAHKTCLTLKYTLWIYFSYHLHDAASSICMRPHLVYCIKS